ncbi:uncharacterized protein LOC126892998 [Diabrotica virgifera virgifera]|uniref:Uncharacterized protein LOC114344162 n=1 Tax=Diabrotica virgifera virgifera TaxID=50390 RepID=A0A6P7GLM8_DIAVI|nr:uncharacterized protein LOC126892998 [Diabrotica virgifera virgifera]
MGSDFEQMYFDLNALLQDICKFLSSDKLENLSPKDQKLAESLINRSKQQLQTIAKIQPPLQPSEDYVIMNNPAPNEDDDKPNDIYSSVEDLNNISENVTIRHSIATQSSDIKLFIDLPAREASQSTKYGWIFMKRKFLLGFEKMKRVYATIHKNCLLIYLNEREMKPLSTFNLEYFEAKESHGDKCNFQLISTVPDETKILYFIALTPKDRLQWTTHINTCHDKAITQYKIEEDTISLPETIYNISPDEDEDDSDGIYEQLTMVKKPAIQNKPSRPPSMADSNNSPLNSPTTKLQPFLRRGSKIKGPLKIPPPQIQPRVLEKQSSVESDVSYHEISSYQVETKRFNSDSNNSLEVDDSFSEGSVDSTYETFSNVQETIKNFKTLEKSGIGDGRKSKPIDDRPAVPVRKKSY